MNHLPAIIHQELFFVRISTPSEKTESSARPSKIKYTFRHHSQAMEDEVIWKPGTNTSYLLLPLGNAVT